MLWASLKLHPVAAYIGSKTINEVATANQCAKCLE